MSLCNTFRLFALSLTIVLSFIDTPAETFTISRSGDFSETVEDLDQEESIRLEVRDDFRRPNNIGSLNRLHPINDTETKDYVYSIPITTIDDQTSENSFGTSKRIEYTTEETSLPENTELKLNESTENIEASSLINDEINKGKDEKYRHISHNLSSFEAQSLPSWKKYTVINRKPVSDLENDLKVSENRSEEMITDETGNPVQDSKTGDIPSLNQIKNFLSFFKSDAQNDTTTSKEITDQSVNDNLGQTQENTLPSTTDKEAPATVESKRGGFLDFSLKSLFEDNEDKKDTSQELTTRPKNRKLSWRIGSRYRSKEDNSGEKQGRLRFRFRNDDEKNSNDRKKDKNDIKTIQESQEEINKNNKDVEHKEDEKDKTRNRNKNKNERNNNDRKDEVMDKKNKNENKEYRTEDNNSRNVDIRENSNDRSGTKTDKPILKERQDFNRKQERNETKNYKESKEDGDKVSQNKGNPQSFPRDNMETSRESHTKQNSEVENKQTDEEKAKVVNIWKIDSNDEDYDRFRSRLGNEKGRSKDMDNKRGNEKPENIKGDRNRSNQSSEKLMNDKDEVIYRSRTRNEKERGNDRRNERERDNDRRNEKERVNDRNNERERDNDRRNEKERNNDQRNEKERGNDRNNERERYNDRRNEKEKDNDQRNERERNNGRRNENLDKNKEERIRNSSSEKDESRSRSRDKGETPNNNRRKENSRDRDNDRRNEKIEKNKETKNRDSKSSELVTMRDEVRSRSRSRNEEDISYNNRMKENSRDRDNDRRNEKVEKNKEEKYRENYSSEKLMNEKDESRSRSRLRNEGESNNRRNENSRDRDNERNRYQSNDKEKEIDYKIGKELQENYNKKSYAEGESNKESLNGKGETIQNVEINKNTLKKDLDDKIPPQTPIQEVVTEKYDSNKNEDSEYKHHNQAPMLDEYTKKFLSTIEEEDESETQTPTKENKNFTSKTKQTEHQNIVAVKYPSDFKFNDMETTQEYLEPNKPYKITSTTIPDTKEELKDKENVTIHLIKNSQLKLNSPTVSSPDIKNQDNSRIVFKDDLVKEQKENDYTKETTSRPNPTFSDERTTANVDDANIQNNVKPTGSLIQMNEDAIREELLKEEIINNYEENKGRYQGDSFETTTMPQTTIPVKIYEVNKPVHVKDTIDEKLSVKPLSILEKLKTTILYPVSPHYKPPKKIEVQPPKTFVRDPDDNSWRNESLSSLGIVFNPKNSSKPFTQVLKNKTETEWNSLLEKSNKNETPDLRERLEKIAEIRKTKKKKTDAFGNVIFNDYEDGNSKENVLLKENYSSVSTEAYTKSTTMLTTEMSITTPKPTTTTTTTTTQATTTQKLLLLNHLKAHIETTTTKPKATTEQPKKVFNVAEYYDSSDEDDADYLTLAKIDLKKFTVPIQSTQEVNTPPSWPVTNNRYVHNKHDDRKPTLQYFPPLTTQKVIYNNKEYNSKYINQKMNAYTDTAPPTNVLPVSYAKKTTSLPNARKEKLFTPTLKSTFRNSFTTNPIEYEKHVYMTPAPGITTGKDAYTFVTDDGSFNKASDVIKHYRDFLNAVAKDHEEDKNADYIPFTKIPTQGVTLSDTFIPKAKIKTELPENYDYDTDYKKDVLQRFVHNFNENSDRLKSNLPLLYNNSIIHSELHGEHGKDVASSRAYLSRLLTRPNGDCENNSTVELSPAYELHYYVPEQEEKEEIDPKSVTLPYQYQL